MPVEKQRCLLSEHGNGWQAVLLCIPDLGHLRPSLRTQAIRVAFQVLQLGPYTVSSQHCMNPQYIFA